MNGGELGSLDLGVTAGEAAIAALLFLVFEISRTGKEHKVGSGSEIHDVAAMRSY